MMTFWALRRVAVLVTGGALLLLGFALTTLQADAGSITGESKIEIDCPSAENPALTDLGRARHLAYCIWKIDNPAGSYWEFSRSDDFPMPGRSILRWQASRTPGSGGFFVSYESSQQQNQGDRGTYQTQQDEQRQDEPEGSRTIEEEYDDIPDDLVQDFIKALNEGSPDPPEDWELRIQQYKREQQGQQ